MERTSLLAVKEGISTSILSKAYAGYERVELKTEDPQEDDTEVMTRTFGIGNSGRGWV